jgi:hypothetical protein
MSGALPQPMNTLALGKSCMFPWDVVSSFSGEVYSCNKAALIFSSSISIAMPRD